MPLVIGLVSMVYVWSMTRATDRVQSDVNTEVGAEKIIPPEQRYPYVIEPGSSLVAALRKLDVSSQVVHELVQAAKPMRDLGRLNAGTRFQIFFSPNNVELLSSVRIRISPQQSLLIEKNDQGLWQALDIKKKIETRVVTFKGTVDSSLWESAVAAKMNPSLISELAEIFAWQVDFAREVRVGDRWRLSVEEETVLGEKIGWGSILSAEYISAEATHTAVLFRVNNEDVGYFAPDGSSLKRIFLKSPIQYGRISSRFQRNRFHPVLKIFRAHHGVDYAAPTGTPIRAVGDGVIGSIGRNPSAGNFIKVRHNATHSTAYKHLSRFASGMRSGTKIQQGQTIGYVGSTGLASGPHLHFEFYVDGKYVDPLGRRFPAADPVPKNQLSVFVESKNIFLAYLPDWETQSESVRQ